MASSHRLRVLTLNCLFRNKPRTRLRAISRELEEIGADVVCLQEVLFRRNVSLVKGHSLAYQPWGIAVKGGLVIVAADAIDSWSFETYRTALWFEWLARKGYLTARLRRDGAAVTIVNTHLLANYSEDWSPGNGYARRQIAELEQLSDAVRKVPDDQLLVVAGDFNVPASSPIFSEFLDATGLQKAVDWSLLQASRGSLGIDNVLYRAPAGQAVRATSQLHFEEPIQLADGRALFASDHVAVAADLEW